MSIRIIVPHRGLAASKTRLAPVLDAREREALAERLLRRVLGVVVPVAPVVVITPSEELRALVEAAGATLEVQHGMGLNAGLEQARARAIHEGTATLAVLHGDLPNLEPDDVRALIDAVPAGTGVAIAPDRRGTGTNGLAMQPPDAIGFHFGVGSFALHRAAAEAQRISLVVVDRPGLAFDLDTPADLARWLELGDAA
ncbi:MAG TPA: 2-phospho-L-lactate guanylyltransferase [Candidatus Limnocylindria bacterium]|nr:2-phospho-L-lactate guanylyltransferase [Candidatus Limnocylindria bacterium]